MAKFNYTAKDEEARLLTGVFEARDTVSVARELKRRNLTIISIIEEKGKKSVNLTIAGGRKKVKSIDLVVFSRQLATLIDAGVSLVVGLNILYEQVEDKYLKQVIWSLKSDIEAGNSLSDSFARYPLAFPPIFANMVKAGESSGSLSEVLERIADYMERTENLKRKIKSAMTYPIIVISMSIIIITFLILKVVPAFKGIFATLGGSLPIPTKILIMVSDSGVRFFPIIIGGLIFSYIVFIRYIHTDKGGMQFDQFKLKLPVFGPLMNKVAISRFTSTFAILVKSGVDILEIFDIIGRVSGNMVIEQAAQQIKINLQAGESISTPMEETGRFPPFVSKMIAVGEQTGELEKMLTKISDYYEAQINESLAGLTAMIEPLIISFLGVTVGFILVAMFFPIFKVTQMMGR